MLRIKLVALICAAILMGGLVMIDSAEAGEKFSAHATSVNTKFHKIEISGIEGQFIAVYENKLIWVDDKTGEKSTGVSCGTMEMNVKTGEGIIRGFSVRTYANGEKWSSKYEGKPVGKGHSKGTYTYTGGTGQFEGLKGSGTWESKAMAPGVSILTAEGVREY